MKYSFITIFVATILFVSIGTLSLEKENRSFDNVFEEMVNTSHLNSYKDSQFGYEVEYPSFLEKAPDSLCEYAGDAKFSFSNYIQIDMETTVTRNEGRDAKNGIGSIARKLHAKVNNVSKDSFILTGRLDGDDDNVGDSSFYCKYVLKGKLWFAYSLYYPDGYKSSIRRLFRIIDGWEPYREYKQTDEC